MQSCQRTRTPTKHRATIYTYIVPVERVIFIWARLSHLLLLFGCARARAYFAALVARDSLAQKTREVDEIAPRTHNANRFRFLCSCAQYSIEPAMHISAPAAARAHCRILCCARTLFWRVFFCCCCACALVAFFFYFSVDRLLCATERTAGAERALIDEPIKMKLYNIKINNAYRIEHTLNGRTLLCGGTVAATRLQTLARLL